MLKGHQDDFLGDGHGHKFHIWERHNHTQIRGRDGVDWLCWPGVNHLS